MKNVYTQNILEGVGNTPLIKLNTISDGARYQVFAKLEFKNPMGSVKDRIAKHMVEKAEKEGRIRPGDTFIDNSSGNTALGLAMVCAVKGYKLKIVVRDSISSEKIKFLRSLEVEILQVDSSLPADSPDSYNNITPRLAKEHPDLCFLDQHNNRDNNEAHYLTTGPEIWEQMEGKIDYFVAGIGTGGTICGVSRFLKERDPKIKVVAVDPAGSIFYDYFHSKTLVEPSRYWLEGLGDEFLIGCVDFDLIDDIYRVTDREAFLKTRELAVKEAILAGGSSGAAVWAVFNLAREVGEKARIVTILPDSANRYLSTIYNDEWLNKNKFL
ncbi:PLP-dependent cysteine synthase family protein [Acidobacteriota bacterium]